MITKTASTKKRRFFYHYYKQKKQMSIHFMGQCMTVNDILCNVPCETKWNKTQPHIVMQGWANEVWIRDNKAVIS